MPVNVIGTLKPKNNGKFPVAEAVDIKVTDDLRLDEALENKADLSTVNFALDNKADKTTTTSLQSQITTVNSALDNKADKTTTTSLQSQINEIITPVTQDAEVQNARVGDDGTSYQTLKARLDAENTLLNDNLKDVSPYIDVLSGKIESGTMYVDNGNIIYSASSTTICTKNKTYLNLPQGTVLTLLSDNAKMRIVKVTDETTTPMKGTQITDYTRNNVTIGESGNYTIALATYDGSAISDTAAFAKNLRVVNSNSFITKLEQSTTTAINRVSTETAAGFSEVKNILTGEYIDFPLEGEIEKGGVDNTGGNYNGDSAYQNSHWRTTNKILSGCFDVKVDVLDDSYRFNFWIYNNDGTVENSGWTQNYELHLNSAYNFGYRIAFVKADNPPITSADIIENYKITYTYLHIDQSLSVPGGIADAKKTGDDLRNIKKFVGYENDITEQVSITYHKNAYVSNGSLVYENNKLNRCLSEIFNFSNEVKVVPDTGIMVGMIEKNGNSWTEGVPFTSDTFIIPADTIAFFHYKKSDDSDFEGDEYLTTLLETYGQSSGKMPQYRIISSITQEQVIDDNSNIGFVSMQGMCFDGENIWYYLAESNILKKYNITSGETTSYSQFDLGHGNDLTFNPNTRLLYVAPSQGSEPILNTINVDTLEESTVTLPEFEYGTASVAYSKELDRYAVIGGNWYDREGNVRGYTRKKLVIYDKNFDPIKIVTLPNDYGADQGIDFDDKYIYMCKTYEKNGVRTNKVNVLDINGDFVNSFNGGTGEIEGIAKIDDNHFYISKCMGEYNGGYVNRATISKEFYESVVAVRYSEYIL